MTQSSFQDSDSGFEIEDGLQSVEKIAPSIEPLKPISKAKGSMSSYNKPSEMFKYNQNTADDQLDAFLSVLDDIESYNNCESKP